MSSAPSNPAPSTGASVPPPGEPNARPVIPTAHLVSSPASTSTAAQTTARASKPTPSATPIVLKGSTGEAGRNLALGLLAALASVPLGGIALFWAPKESFVSLATALLLGVVMFLAIQFRLLLQRNGVFLLLAGGFSLALAVPIAVRLLATGSEWAQTLADFKRQQAAVSPRPAVQPPQSQSSEAASSPKPPQPPAPSAPEPVAVAPTPIEAREAQGAPIMKTAPAPPVPEPEAHPDEDPVQRTTRLAKDEAIRRYPALQSPGNPEHTVYLEAYNELARLRKFDFFKDPKWPLNLAEIVALREGWKRADLKPAGTKALEPGATPAPLPGSEFALDGPQAATASGAATPTAPAPTTTDPNEQAVNKAMVEARRRYPAVGKEGSPENKAYLEAYQELDRLRPDFFEAADWPLRLVELVAKREGWKRVEGEAGSEKGVERKSAGSPELPLPQ